MSVNAVDLLQIHPSRALLPANLTLTQSWQSTRVEGEGLNVLYNLAPNNKIWFEEDGELVKSVSREMVVNPSPTEIFHSLRLVRVAGEQTSVKLVQTVTGLSMQTSSREYWLRFL